MTAGSSDGRGEGSATPVSLFRRGRVDAGQPASVDLLKGREIFASPAGLARVNPARVWESLSEFAPDPAHLAGNGLFPDGSADPAVAAFDLLRTRLLQGLDEHGWSRVAITSPTHGCGKSFVAINLALSLARRPQGRAVLIDLDLRSPSLAGLLGVGDAPHLAEFLSGEQPLESHFRRIGRTLAVGLNGAPVERPAETLGDPGSIEALEAMHQQLAPEVVVCDMPPALVCDDVLAMAGQVDAVLLVTDGTRTSPADIRATERLFAGRLPLMGVVLNRAQDRGLGRYRWGRR